jgi:hypothetical protein
VQAAALGQAGAGGAEMTQHTYKFVCDCCGCIVQVNPPAAMLGVPYCPQCSESGHVLSASRMRMTEDSPDQSQNRQQSPISWSEGSWASAYPIDMANRQHDLIRAAMGSIPFVTPQKIEGRYPRPQTEVNIREHPTHGCPTCGRPAPVLETLGEGFCRECGAFPIGPSDCTKERKGEARDGTPRTWVTTYLIPAAIGFAVGSVISGFCVLLFRALG